MEEVIKKIKSSIESINDARGCMCGENEDCMISLEEAIDDLEGVLKLIRKNSQAG
jgi:hypothetical protein